MLLGSSGLLFFVVDSLSRCRLDGSWFPLYFHRQRNIKFSFQRHILYWYNKINLLVVPKARPLRTKFQKSSCLRHENSIVGMDPRAWQHMLIVTGIYQVKSYMSYLQQYTKIIKKLTLKFYFSSIVSNLKRTRSQITSNLYVSNWKSSYDVMLVMFQSRQ